MIVPFIEVSVVGDENNPYWRMQQFDYNPAPDLENPDNPNPANDPNNPPCDILEVVYMENYYAEGINNNNYGHTWFDTGEHIWSWDTKGLTPHTETGASPEAIHYINHGYFTAFVYAKALDSYMTEGAYPEISETVGPLYPQGGDPCPIEGDWRQCFYFNHSSPMNLDNDNEVLGEGLPDETVEFNAISFSSWAVISSNFEPLTDIGKEYTREDVLKRTITHEMGHAILATISDPDSEWDDHQHCVLPDCIMYESTEDWELHPFGSSEGCTHSRGMIYDIRQQIHNSTHGTP